MKKLTRQEFIKKAKLIHGNKYDYSLVIFNGSAKKIKIICTVHGIFEQVANNHTSQRQGCPKCIGRNKTNDEFINECRLIHGDKYDYSNVNYINNKTKVKIICPIHGEFKQIPNSHLRGTNCYECVDNKCNTEEFIEKANKIHGNKYGYSLVKYVNNKTKVRIICPIHGEFNQESGSHLSGVGCPKCIGRNKTNDEFIKECRLIHGDKYDYSLLKYNGVFKKIKIICPIHGEFEQMSDKHLKGHGCPFCKESKGEKEINKLLVENNVKFIRQHKFPDCKDKKQLPFDFYIPDYNTCIEYDGRQHFEPIDRWGGLKGLIDQQKKDAIKTNFCCDNNINLVRISYKDNITLELNKKLTILVLNKNKNNLHNIYN